jgi:UDP-glucose 4-epimerase
MDDVKPCVLVTGGAGYIGSHAVLALRDGGYRVVVVDDLSTGCRELVPDDVPFIVGDIADQPLISDLLRTHACVGVMHFAGSIVVPESVSDPLKYYANNTAASRDLIECCVHEGIRAFIFSSTAVVYGVPSEVPISETADTRPISPYGTSKLMTEWILRDVAATTDLRYAALRYFNVAGADLQGRSGQAGPNTTHLIRVACELISGKRNSMEIFGTDYDTPDGTCIRDYVHVSDLVDAHLLALEHLLSQRENLILNCGYGLGYSVRQVLDVARELSEIPLNISTTDRRDGDAPQLISDSSKIRDTLNWYPRLNDLRAIIESALEWEQR